MKSLPRSVALTLLAASLVGCAASRPVLYPNPKLNQSGPAVSKLAVEDCQRKADAANVDDGQAAEVAKSTGVGAAVGAATGAAVGAVLGNAGRGAATGAAGGGAHGLIGRAVPLVRPEPAVQGLCRSLPARSGLRGAGLEVVARTGWLAYRRAVKPGVPAVRIAPGGGLRTNPWNLAASL